VPFGVIGVDHTVDANTWTTRFVISGDLARPWSKALWIFGVDAIVKESIFNCKTIICYAIFCDTQIEG
jgi:hypothetical protein